MIWQRQRLGDAGAVAVMGDDGELDGLVLEEQLWAVPSERRAMMMLTNLMVPFSQLARATPDEDAVRRAPPHQPAAPDRDRVVRRPSARRRAAEAPRRAPQAGAGPGLQPLSGSIRGQGPNRTESALRRP